MSSSANSVRSRLVTGALIAMLGLAARGAQAQELTLALAQAQAPAPAAPNVPVFSKNYFVTGDYLVSGVGLKGKGGADGFARDSIVVAATALPDNAEPVAAFLYWASVVTQSNKSAGLTGAQFNGQDIATLTKVLNPLGTSPCWSSGGATGSPDGSKQMIYHRADVLRYLNHDATGRLVAPGTYQVKLPDSGSTGNEVTFTLGASLVVIYRDPSKPLTSIVIYDGGYSMNNATQSMTQTIRGFYQASTTSPAARGKRSRRTARRAWARRRHRSSRGLRGCRPRGPTGRIAGGRPSGRASRVDTRGLRLPTPRRRPAPSARPASSATA